MQTLLAISILLLIVLLLTGAALVRDFRSTRRRVRRLSARPSRQQPDFAQHLLAAAEAHNVVPSRAVQAQTVKQVMANKTWNQPEIITAQPNQEVQVDYGVQVAYIRPVPAARNRLQSPHRVGSGRVNWTCFNTSPDVLTATHQTSRIRANSRDQAPSTKRF